MNIALDAAYIFSSYLLGSVPHLAYLARIQHVSLDGDYHITLWRQGKRISTIVGILGEFAKAAIPVILGKYLGFDIGIIALAGLAAVCGQMWPVFQRFDGEKGNTVGLAMAASLTIIPLLFALIPIFIGVSIRTVPRAWAALQKRKAEPVLGGSFSRSMPLAMMGGFWVLPLASWLLDEPGLVITSYLALILLLFIRRLTAGLGRDLEASKDLKRILLGRLLFDRGISRFRSASSDLEC